MFGRSHRLLSLVLVLLIAVGPIGGAMAKAQVCDPAKGVVSDSMTHAEHVRHQVSNEDMLQDPQTQGCNECASDCCMSGACSTSACGGGAAALLTHETIKSTSISSATIAAEPQRPLAEPQSPPFRPPQV